METSSLTEPLRKLAADWREKTRGAGYKGGLAAAGVVWVAALLVARHGTWQARAAAALAMVACLAAPALWDLRAARRLGSPAQIVRKLAGPVDRARADKALRALSLLTVAAQPGAGGTSIELAGLHVERAVGALPIERIAERAARMATRAAKVALVLGTVALGLALTNAWSVLEGADVLAATGGIAPVSMRWLDGVETVARPPDYVHMDEMSEIDPGPLVLPHGTVLTLRGMPLHPGRSLRLSDGTGNEVPLVDDGSGGAVARWTVTRSCDLRVVARFGAVAIPEPKALSVTAVADRDPVVTLEGAPRRLMLAEQKEDLPIRYEATDDHGLREVDLVLRAGVREERRVLARLEGEARTEGGHVLRLRDGFLRKSHVPVEITVEAKDNDPLTGPKWGASPAITIVPPDVGEPEAQRLGGLRSLRDRLVDTLATRLDGALPADAAARKAFAASDRARAEADDDAFDRAIGDSDGGLRVPPRSRMILIAQREHVASALAAEARAPTPAAHEAVVKATERFTLVLDAIVRGLGVRDARASAKELSDVAGDLAAGANQAQGDDEATRTKGVARMDAATMVLGGGAVQLRRLGALGLDLGEIVDADLARVRRGRDGRDLPHAELAARDLAARLGQPDPSFGSRGGSSARRAAGESGGARGSQGDEQDTPDEVERAYEQAAADLEQLGQDHAGEMARLEQAMAEAASGDDSGEMRQEARRRAAAVRDAVRPLPAVGSGSNSWTSKGAAARELAEQMARSLEQGALDQAAESARSAAGSLDEAKRQLERGSWLQDPDGTASKEVGDARRKIEAQRAWVEAELEQLRKRTAERAHGQVVESGDQEGKLADRARKLGDRERDKGAFPQEAIEAIDDAARAAHAAADALRRGDAEQGMARQREAQRDLEEASSKLRGEDEEGRPPEETTARPGDNVDIPGKEKHKGPVEFRRRIVHGLAMPTPGGLKDAVRRYAQGLLR